MHQSQLSDQHIHSEFSPDSKVSVGTICEASLARGMSVIAITDHCECDSYWRFDYDHTTVASAQAAKAAADQYRGRLEVLAGIELGQAFQEKEVACKVLSRAPYDFVLGSMHNTGTFEDFSKIDLATCGESLEDLLAMYYEEMVQLVRWDQIDSLAHLTYPLRYLEGGLHMEIDMTPYLPILDEVYRALIETGTALEINTSGLRQAYGKCMPDLGYLKRYRELGGELITIGSDAHFPQDVSAGIIDGHALAKAAGFTHITYFKGRSPRYIKLD